MKHAKDKLEKVRTPHRNVNEEISSQHSALDMFALWITEKVGTVGFFIIIAIWTTLWLGWNFLAPANLQFDPPMGFVFWLFLSNLIQILLMPLIMLGQNIQGQHAQARADYQLEINIKSEKEIEILLDHLDHQNKLIEELIVEVRKNNT